jgi:hypothetical protein
VIVEIRESEVEHVLWSLLDQMLDDLVETHKVHGDLTLQIATRVDQEYITRLLPRIAQQGVLEVCYGVHPSS